MTDVDRLTVVVAVGFVLLIHRLPERSVEGWGCARFTFDLAMIGVLMLVVTVQVLGALGLIR